jgi:TFIIF-interacting CTD phosphatase-like protein
VNALPSLKYYLTQPAEPFFGDPDDTSLVELLPLLEELSKTEDVRKVFFFKNTTVFFFQHDRYA